MICGNRQPDTPDVASIPTSSPNEVDTPAPRDYAKEYKNILETQIDMAPDFFAAEAEFRPQYAQLDFDITKQVLPQYLSLYESNVPTIARTAHRLQSAETYSDMLRLKAFAPDVIEAYRKANPEAAAILDELNSQALDELQAGAKLSPSESRAVTQNTRAALNDRGMIMGNPAIFEEAMNLDLYGRQRQSERRGFAAEVLGYNKAIYGDPVQTILGRPSSNLGFALGSRSVPQGTQVGPQLFNPESAYASQLYGQNASNAMQSAITQFGGDQDYFNTIYNAQAAASIAGANNQAALYGAGIGALGNLGGSAMIAAALCWIAQAVYGEASPRWKLFRVWLLTRAPFWFLRWYLRFGPAVAAGLKDQKDSRDVIRRWMNSKIEELSHAV